MSVLLDESFLEKSLANLNSAAVDVTATVLEKASDSEPLTFGGQKIKAVDFAAAAEMSDEKILWLISGYTNGTADIIHAKERLTEMGIAADKILNFELSAQINLSWLGNLRYAEKNAIECFATGGSFTELGLDLDFIPGERGKAVNLSSDGQDLRQSFLTAKHVFEHAAAGAIKRAIIGLAEDAAKIDAAESFNVLPKDFQYEYAFKGAAAFDSLKYGELLSDDFKDRLATVEADFNQEREKADYKRRNPAKNSAQKISASDENITANISTLKEYIALCREHGAKAVGLILPQSSESGKISDGYRQALKTLEKEDGFTLIDLSGVNLSAKYFYDARHLNLKGASAVSVLLSARLYTKRIITASEICGLDSKFFELLSKVYPKNYKAVMSQIFLDGAKIDFKQLMTKLPQADYDELIEQKFLDKNYDSFKKLSNKMHKDEYNELMKAIFEVSARKLRKKSKLQVGFVIFNSSMWCGDDLYRLFEQDERYEPTVFLCRRTDKTKNPLAQEEFQQSVERFKSHGLNLVVTNNVRESMPPQDILILLSPYIRALPEDFRTAKLTPRTLILNIPYSLSISKRDDFLDSSLFHIVWKMFFSSQIALELHDKMCSVGMPRGVYGGYPKMDEFFDPKKIFSFSWKLTRPDARKIIYAPHWSINGATNYATFQWNWQFMYEFAKAHPEISWVVKPHPGLFFSSVKEKIFASHARMEEYFRKWDELPNAQVYTGNYYQSIFATSDGMIHDSGSFIAEYQYVDKPMIFLTREGEVFNGLGEKILSASYLVDGKDCDAIAAEIQRVFIDGNDDKAAARKAVFDEYLNYPKYLGMSSSEFTYKSIADDLKEQ